MEKKLSVQNLAEELAAANGMTLSGADEFVRAFFAVIEEGLRKDGIVKVKGWGTFKLSAINDRESVNVTTGERFVIKGHQRVTFLPEASLKEFINRPFAQFETVELSSGYDAQSEIVETQGEAPAEEEPVEEYVVETETVQATESAAEQTTEAVVEQTTEEATEAIAEQTTDEATEAVVEQTTEEVAEPIADETPEQASNEVAEQTAEEPAEESVEETESVQAPESAAEEATEAIVEQTTEEITEPIAEEPVEQVSDEVVEEAVDQTATEPVDQVPDEATEQASEEVVSETLVETSEQESEAVVAETESVVEEESIAETTETAEAVEDIVPADVEATETADIETTEEKASTEEIPSEEPVSTFTSTPLEPTDTPSDVSKKTNVRPPKTRASWRYWLPILLVLVIGCCIYIYFVFGDSTPKTGKTFRVSEKDKIKVESIDWDDHPSVAVSDNKTDKEAATDKEIAEKPSDAETVAAESKTKEETISAPANTPADTNGSMATNNDASQSATTDKPTAPAKTTDTTKPQTSTAADATTNLKTCIVQLPEADLAKNIKDITAADTTSFVIDGTLTTHELQSGETIIRLAQLYYGDKRLWPYIVKYNWMKNPDNVHTGTVINIPKLKNK